MREPHDHHVSVEDLSTKELLHELVESTRFLARQEADAFKGDVSEGRSRLAADLALARGEIGAEIKEAKRAGTSAGAGAVLLHASLYFLMGFLALVLRAAGLPLWAGVLIVGLLALGAGALLVKGGTTRLKRVHLTPKRTIERLKEEKSWMRDKIQALSSKIRASA